MKSLSEINFNNIKTVGIRVDFNIPVDENFKITDNTRILRALNILVLSVILKFSSTGMLKSTRIPTVLILLKLISDKLFIFIHNFLIILQ